MRKPYLSPQLSYAERIDVLIDHYQIVLKAHYGDLLGKSAARQLKLHEFTGKSEAAYQLTLTAVDASRRDGEMTLRLRSKGVDIYTASFVFATIDGVRCLRLGGLQGLLAIDRTLRIKHITRDLYGCRPRDLILHVLHEIGNGFDCKKIVLIGNDKKLSFGTTYACKKSSDYDLIWKEWNAAPRDDGDYELPCAGVHSASSSAVAPDAASMTGEPSKRRILLDTIQATLRVRLGREKSADDYVIPDRAPAAGPDGDGYAARLPTHAGQRTTPQ
jgi:hypothetical protein